MKKLLVFFFLSFLLILRSFLPLQSHADGYDEGKLDSINQQIAVLTNQLNQSIAATQPLKSQLDSMTKQIAQIKQNVAGIEQDLSIKKQQIDAGYANLENKQKVLNSAIRDFYINSYTDSPLLTILSAKTAAEVTENLAYQQANANQEKTMITNLVLSITELETEKQELTTEETQLIATKANLDTQSAKLDTIVSQAQSYQQTLSRTNCLSYFTTTSFISS